MCTHITHTYYKRVNIYTFHACILHIYMYISLDLVKKACHPVTVGAPIPSPRCENTRHHKCIAWRHTWKSHVTLINESRHTFAIGASKFFLVRFESEGLITLRARVLLRYTWNEYTHSFSEDTSNEYTRSFCRHINRNQCKAYSHSPGTHEMHIHMYTQCFLRTGCDFVSARVCHQYSVYTRGFLQMVSHTPWQCVWWASTNSSCVALKYSVLPSSHHEYLDLLSHCVWRLTRTVPLSPSHRVVYLTRTVLLKYVLLLPSLSLEQCTRSTLFISSHTLRCNMFLCITPRLHSVVFIVVLVTV